MGAISTYTTAAEYRVDQAAWEAVSMPATTAGLHPVIADVLTRQLRIAASPCMCGATDCPSCGPAQGYEVVRAWRDGRWIWINPDSPEDVPVDEVIPVDVRAGL